MYFIASFGLMVCGFCTSKPSNYFEFIIVREAARVFNRGLQLVSFILILKVVGQDYRTFCNNAFLSLFALGITVLEGISYFTPTRRLFYILSSVPKSILLFVSNFIIRESLRWLFRQRKVVDIEIIMQHIVRQSGLCIFTIGLKIIIQFKADNEINIKLSKIPILRRDLVLTYF